MDEWGASELELWKGLQVRGPIAVLWGKQHSHLVLFHAHRTCDGIARKLCVKILGAAHPPNRTQSEPKCSSINLKQASGIAFVADGGGEGGMERGGGGASSE